MTTDDDGPEEAPSGTGDDGSHTSDGSGTDPGADVDGPDQSASETGDSSDESGSADVEPSDGRSTDVEPSDDQGSGVAVGSTGNEGGPPRPGSGPAAGSSDDSRRREEGDGGRREGENVVQWFFRTDDEAVAAIRDVVTTVAAVLIVGLFLFAVSGIWPPLVAVESGSMEPHMFRGDLVFIVDEHRFAGQSAVAGTGVVTHSQGEETGYWSFGDHGNVIVFRPNGNNATPIIHRAMFYVEENENWYDRANESYVRGADNCQELLGCPSKKAGFITKGDANPSYDQAVGRTKPVRPQWVKGKAKVRIPWLGWIRLEFAERSRGASLSAGDTVRATPSVGENLGTASVCPVTS